MPAPLRARVLAGFEELLPKRWEELLAASPAPVVFLTRDWLEAWWDSLGCGRLLLVVAERDGRAFALAPFFAVGGVVRFLGAQSSDYLDLLGDASDPVVLEAVLRAARDATERFERFTLDELPEASPTSALLPHAAAALELVATVERTTPAPTLAGEGLTGAATRKSLLRHERWFSRNGRLEIRHTQDGREILPELDRFFDQHIARWQATPHPSLFLHERHRTFYRLLAQRNSDASWLRFTRVDWNSDPVAYHFGMAYDGSYLWYKPSFDIALARRSPGEVLLRHLLLAATQERAHTFDFGIGDEPFKYRFATHIPRVQTWTLGTRA